MEKSLRLINRHMTVIFLISVVFLSVTQYDVTTKYNLSVTCSETMTATYPELTFSTYLGGDDGAERGYGIVVTNNGSFYVTGQTSSNDFPTMSAFNSNCSGNRDVFLTKFSQDNSLLWSTYFGGHDLEVSKDIGVGMDGSCYIIGTTLSDDFPVQNAYDNTYSGNEDVFIAKFASNGSLLWSTFFGGSDWDFGYSIAVAADGSCYLTGETWSSNFPTKNAYDSTYNGYIEAFVAKFSTDGTLLWSTFLGGNGNDAGHGLAVSSDGSCYVTGLTRSTDFPTKNGYDTTSNGYWDVFVTKFHPNGALNWSTLLGGSDWDEGLGIATGSDGSCYVTGYTSSADFPTGCSYSTSLGEWGDAFVVKFATDGSLLWSTFLGGNGGDRGYDITVTSEESCYITGETASPNFPTKNTTIASLVSGFDGFISKFSSGGNLLWSSYLGGSQTDKGYGIAATNDGCCYVVGTTHSPDFPTSNAFDITLGATSDAFISIFRNTPTFSGTPTPCTPQQTPQNINIKLLVIIVVIPITTFIVVIILILSKKRK
jgi:hypothetical protein